MKRKKKRKKKGKRGRLQSETDTEFLMEPVLQY